MSDEVACSSTERARADERAMPEERTLPQFKAAAREAISVAVQYLARQFTHHLDEVFDGLGGECLDLDNIKHRAQSASFNAGSVERGSDSVSSWGGIFRQYRVTQSSSAESRTLS